MSNSSMLSRFAAAAFGALAIGATAFSAPATAAPLPLFPFFLPQIEAAPPPVAAAPEEEERFELPARLRRQVVNYYTREAPGTIIIDTPNTYLYLVLGNGQALRYGIGIGRDGFTWSGTQTITRQGRMAGLDPAPANDCPPALFAAPHDRRPG
ncbi:lipoprotein-anchoring transpeptidase ErfK/SrfK [Bradyrhizobium sp. AZCC 1588]